MVTFCYIGSAIEPFFKISFYKVVILIDLDVHGELCQKLNKKTSLGMWETLSGDGGRLCLGMVGDTLYMSPTIPRLVI